MLSDGCSPKVFFSHSTWPPRMVAVGRGSSENWRPLVLEFLAILIHGSDLYYNLGSRDLGSEDSSVLELVWQPEPVSPLPLAP